MARCCKQMVQVLVALVVEALEGSETPPKATAQNQMVPRKQGSKG